MWKQLDDEKHNTKKQEVDRPRRMHQRTQAKKQGGGERGRNERLSRQFLKAKRTKVNRYTIKM